MSSYKKLFSNTFFMLLGRFSTKILSFLLVPLYTSILSTEEYGTYDLVVTTVSLLTPFFTLVISEAVMRFCLDKGCDSNQVLTIGLTIVALATIVLCLLYPVFLLIKTLSNYFFWILIFFVFSNIEGVLMQYLKGIEKIKLYTICGVISTLISIVLNILFLLVFDLRIEGYMLAVSISQFAVILIIVFFEKIWNKITNPIRIKRLLYTEMIRYSAPMMPNSISWWISNSSDKYMILYIISAGAVGLYSVSYKIPTLLTIFTSIFISALQISSVEAFGSEKSQSFLSDVYRFFASGNIIVSAILVSIAMPIAKIIFQNEFFEAWKFSAILIVAYTFNALAGFYGTIYTASKKSNNLLYSTLIGAGVNIVLNVFLIRWIGLYGAAISTMISYITVWLIRVVHSRKILRLDVNFIGNIVSFLLLFLEIFLVIYFETLFCIWGLLVAFIIVIINMRDLIKTNIGKGILRKLKIKK